MDTVLITGGSRGIGRACVRLFAKSGWRVAFFYRAARAAAEELSRETGVVAIACDVSDARAVEGGVAQARLLLGHIDALVNNAGISRTSLLTDCSDEMWREMMGVNLDGVFYVSRAVLPGMIARKAGAIVNVSSMWGVSGASCEASYSASKAGVIGLTKALAKEVGPSNIRVNCVCPGAIDTDMNANLTPNDLQTLCDDTPLGRLGRPDEVAQAILFLCEARASFITGQALLVDGGYLN